MPSSWFAAQQRSDRRGPVWTATVAGVVCRSDPAQQLGGCCRARDVADVVDAASLDEQLAASELDQLRGPCTGVRRDDGGDAGLAQGGPLRGTRLDPPLGGRAVGEPRGTPLLDGLDPD